MIPSRAVDAELISRGTAQGPGRHGAEPPIRLAISGRRCFFAPGFPSPARARGFFGKEIERMIGKEDRVRVPSGEIHTVRAVFGSCVLTYENAGGWYHVTKVVKMKENLPAGIRGEK